MKRQFQHRRLSAALALLFLVSAAGSAGEQSFLPDMQRFANPSGAAATFSTAGKVDLTGPFFQSLGANGRACVLPPAGDGVDHHAAERPGTLRRHGRHRSRLPHQRRLELARRRCRLEARRVAYGMLLSKALIRVGIGIPANAEFVLDAVDDPYGPQR